jgi:hypothetical protein
MMSGHMNDKLTSIIHRKLTICIDMACLNIFVHNQVLVAQKSGFLCPPQLVAHPSGILAHQKHDHYIFTK